MVEFASRIWLSVLIPVYNVAPYLAQCVESVMEQADEGVQLLLLDDVSTDDSLAIAEQLQARWPQVIKVLRHAQNQGLSAARNTLLQHCCGDYVWFLDSDDFLLDGAISGLKKTLEAAAGQPDIVLCDFALWRARLRLKHRLRGEAHRRSFHGESQRMTHDREALLRGLMLSGQMHAWSKIARRTLWLESGVRFPEGAFFEDMATMPLLALHAQSFVYASHAWVAYRQREGSILSAMSIAKASDLAAALLPFAREWRIARESDPLLRQPPFEFALSHLALRNYLGAMRALAALQHQRQLPSSQVESLSAQFTAQYRAVSPLTAQQVLAAYLKRGWLARYWRARQWLRKRAELE